jgi:CheY-like chemotaxis protein
VIAAIEQPFDLIILDMLMPGLDGLKTIRVLQKVAPGVPVLGLTGYVGRGYVADAAAMGVTVLSKPIKIAHLLAEINDVLAQTVTVE